MFSTSERNRPPPEADLQAHFQQAGTVTSVAIVKDRSSGRSKGFDLPQPAAQLVPTRENAAPPSPVRVCRPIRDMLGYM